ncbi:MAG: TIGR02391 family protein [Thermoleophilia bacterium]|nr:TIGR02391 family protein [Thermoleophilia bacterium]
MTQALRFRRVISPMNPAAPMHRARLDRAIQLLRELEVREGTLSTPPAPALATLHPAVQERSAALYSSGHFSEAVEAAFKVVRARLRDLTGHETGSEAFGKGALRVNGAAATWVDEDFNERLKFLTMAIDRFRNEKAHVVDGNVDQVKAFEYLVISSLAMRLLDNPRQS